MILVFVWSIVGVAATQPNAVFTIGLLVVPYLFLQIPAYLTYFKVTKNRKVVGSIVGVVLAAAIAGFWALLYNAKFMQRTVTWQWPSFEGKRSLLLMSPSWASMMRSRRFYLEFLYSLELYTLFSTDACCG